MESTTPGLLAGRVAIVTGSGHSLGRAFARHLAAAGADVVVAEIDAAAGERVRAEIADAGGSAIAVATDVSEPDQTRAMAQAALDTFGRIDVLINNAAVFETIPISRSGFEDIDLEEWDRVVRVNLRGMWLSCQAAVPTMRAQGYGKIINISSTTAFRSTAGRIHYVTTKAGVLGFTRTLATELGADGIRVNSLVPGKLVPRVQAGDSVQDEGLRRAIEGQASTQVLPGELRPDDIAPTAVFLAGPGSDAITGQSILVNAGAAMH